MCILLHLSLKKAIERDFLCTKNPPKSNQCYHQPFSKKKVKIIFSKQFLFFLQSLQNMLVFKMKNRTVYIQSHVFVYYNK